VDTYPKRVEKKIKVKGNVIHPIIVYQHPKLVEVMNAFTALPKEVEVHPNRKIAQLLADLFPETPWGDRKIAARKLGNMRD
jgi:hypothetical protein